MGKVSSTYPSLLGGVSQAPESRRDPSYAYDIVNMVPDAVLGWARRNGSVRQAAQSISGTATLDAAEYLDASGFVGYDFSSGDVDYTLFLRKQPKPGASQITAAAICVNKTAGTLLTVSVKGGDTAVDALVGGGASSACNVGALLAIAGKTITPTYTTTYPWAIEENQKRAVIWVRGGAYSRRYRMAIVRGNQKLWVQYTTKNPAFPGRLDTSDLNPAATDYLKRVNDRTNAYNTAATQWINAALQDITPENIAANLANALIESGFIADPAYVEVIGSCVCITDPSIEDVEADDGGDGPLIRAVGNTVGAPELLSSLGYPGKVVKVRPGNSPDGQVFYLRARAKDGSSGEFTPCTWEETPGELFTPTLALVFAAVSGSTCYLSSDVAWINTNAGTNFPALQPNTAGDRNSNPPPEFFNSKITNVAVFQDRLIVSKANGYVATSRPGDYLNFFRQSVLTVVDNDPVSFAIIGGESDTVRHSLMYDRNLVLIGDKKQYLISGKQKLAPGSASATVMSSVPGTTGSAPVLVEDRLFYTKGNNGYGSLHWFKPGQIAESPVTEEATGNITTYIPGAPTDLLAVLTPDLVVVRTPNDVLSSKLYLLHYGVLGRGRMNAVHRWEFAAGVGPLAGMAHLGGKLFLVTFRQSGADIDAVLDTIELQPNVAQLPYLDSMSTVNNGQPLKARAEDYVGGEAADTLPGSGTPYYGYALDSKIVLGTPRVLSQTGEPVMDGDLIVSSLDIKLSNAGGVVVNVDNSLDTWQGYLRGREAYVAPVYPEVDCSEDGFPACAGASAEPPPEQFTHYVVLDKSGSGVWTVGTPMTIASGVPYTGYLLTHPDNPNVYGPEYNIGAAALVDDGQNYMRPLAEGASRHLVTGNTSAQVHIPLVAGGTVTVENLEDWVGPPTEYPSTWVRFTTSSGEVYLWSEMYGAGEFTYTITRVTAEGPECEPCEPLTPVVVSDSGFLGDSIAHEERRMSISDAGSPTAANPVTDAAPYEQVTLHLPIGRRAGQYRATIAAYHWAPLTIASVDWTGQYHNRTRRM